MDVQITRPGDSWQYDPLRYGYSSGDVLKTVSGSPSVSSNKLRLNAAEVVSMQGFRLANFSFTLNIPAVPTLADVRSWGIKTTGANSVSVAKFDIADTVFSAKVYDRVGTIIGTKTINWSSDWTATDTIFSIRISERNVFFVINETIVARFEETVEIKQTVQLTIAPLCLDVKNTNADNVDISLLSVY